MITIVVHVTEYGPWVEGSDWDRPNLGTDSETIVFDNAAECAQYLKTQGLQEPSQSPVYNASVWLSDVDAYEHPYTGVLQERSVHPVGVHPRVWVAIVEAVRWTS